MGNPQSAAAANTTAPTKIESMDKDDLNTRNKEKILNETKQEVVNLNSKISKLNNDIKTNKLI